MTCREGGIFGALRPSIERIRHFSIAPSAHAFAFAVFCISAYACVIAFRALLTYTFAFRKTIKKLKWSPRIMESMCGADRLLFMT